MAVNHADGTMYTSVAFYPVAAGIGAAQAGAGWLTVFFVPLGLLVGVGIIYFGRKLIYSITGFALSRDLRTSKRWVQQVCFVPFFLLYIILPYAIVCAGVFGIWSGSAWLAKQL